MLKPKDSVAEIVAANMVDIMDSDEYRSVFSKTAAKKDKEEDDKGKGKGKKLPPFMMKGKDKDKDKSKDKPKDKGDDKKKKKSKAERLELALNGMLKISAILDELELVKSSELTLEALSYIVSEAKKKDDDDDDKDEDDKDDKDDDDKKDKDEDDGDDDEDDEDEDEDDKNEQNAPPPASPSVPPHAPSRSDVAPGHPTKNPPLHEAPPKAPPSGYKPPWERPKFDDIEQPMQADDDDCGVNMSDDRSAIDAGLGSVEGYPDSNSDDDMDPEELRATLSMLDEGDSPKEESPEDDKFYNGKTIDAIREMLGGGNLDDDSELAAKKRREGLIEGHGRSLLDLDDEGNEGMDDVDPEESEFFEPMEHVAAMHNGQMIVIAKDKPRTEFIFAKSNPKVKDKKDHFPINTEGRARNALDRANQFSKAPPWYSGSLQSLVSAVARAVKSKYKGITVSKKSTKPGKG